MSLTALENEVGNLLREHRMMLSALRDALDYIADQSDVYDGDYGQQMPNRAMVLSQELMGVISKVGA